MYATALHNPLALILSWMILIVRGWFQTDNEKILALFAYGIRGLALPPGRLL